MAACLFLPESNPSAIASDSTSSYVYVTDLTSGNVLGFSVASGQLTPLPGSPFPAGNQPTAIVADPTYPFIYVANALDSTVSAYSMSNGVLTRLGVLRHGHAARGHRHRSIHPPLPLHRQLSRQRGQRHRLRL